LKLAVAIILSNVFFYVLFSNESENIQEMTGASEGWVEVQLEAELLTPFHPGKKVLIVHRSGRKKIEGILKITETDRPGKITVLVKEDEAHQLFYHENWQILPFMKHLTFTSIKKGQTHEIRY
jgi:hypothetical protein